MAYLLLLSDGFTICAHEVRVAQADFSRITVHCASRVHWMNGKLHSTFGFLFVRKQYSDIIICRYYTEIYVCVRHSYIVFCANRFYGRFRDNFSNLALFLSLYTCLNWSVNRTFLWHYKFCSTWNAFQIGYNMTYFCMINQCFFAIKIKWIIFLKSAFINIEYKFLSS